MADANLCKTFTPVLCVVRSVPSRIESRESTAITAVAIANSTLTSVLIRGVSPTEIKCAGAQLSTDDLYGLWDCEWLSDVTLKRFRTSESIHAFSAKERLSNLSLR
eukprot:IDg1950t1